MSLLDCIKRIPSLNEEIINTYPNQFIGLEKMKNKIKKIIFVASGSSYNAACVSKHFVENQCEIEVEVIFPNVFNQQKYHKNDESILYVFISQTGATKLVYEIVDDLQNKGYQVASIVGELDSPIAKISKNPIDMGCQHEEYKYKTIGVSTSIVTCWLLGCYLSDYKEIKELSIVNNQLDNIVEKALEWYDSHKYELMKRNLALFTGSNSLWPVSTEADIKFMEMIPYLTKSYELEEFIHGPQNEFNNNELFFVATKKGIEDQKSIAISKFLKNEIGCCYMVGNLTLDGNDFEFPCEESHFYELKHLCFYQVIAYKLADDRGRNLNQGLNTIITSYINKTM